MGNVAIRVEGLGKKYLIGGPQQKYDRLGDQVLAGLASPFKKAGNVLRGRDGGASGLKETVWALKDVSFEIKHGEAVGIIGRNGAGKSTLLKILSQITEPSTGYADLYGRVGSLLEVGTGFHPELTGRENVFLNGAILGMSRSEIQRKFDEIVDFAEIEQFVDTPVKHYSSGMYVRLAFSVAAHLEPEILLVDEVLAVGDVAFQRKCLGKMDDVTQEGRTVLFVSHNMGLMQTLCERGVYLFQGAIESDSAIEQAVGKYLASLSRASAVPVALRNDREGSGKARVISVSAFGPTSEDELLRFGRSARFRFETDRLLPGMGLTFLLFDSFGQRVTAFHSTNTGQGDIRRPTKEPVFECFLDRLLLLPGDYRVDYWLTGDNSLLDAVRSAITIKVLEGDLDGRVVQGTGKYSVAIPHNWSLPSTAS